MRPHEGTTNCFAILGLPESLTLDPASVEEAWRGLNREGDDTGARSSDWNHARSVLADPVSRLGHWLELRNPGAPPDRAIAPELMDLFAAIGPVLAAADALFAKHRSAATALARAMLAREMIASQIAVQELMAKLHPLKTELVDRFPRFEDEAESGRYDEARRTLGQLKFIRRWEEQCRERLLAFLAA